jgi:hypothetical protein
MTRHSTDATVKLVGLAVGLAAAAALLLLARVPADDTPVGAQATFVADPPGELLVSGSRAFLRARDLVQGGPAASGRLTLRNITERPLAVRVRVAASKPDLNRALQLELGDARSPVAAGRLGDLRGWSRAALRLKPGERRVLDARAAVAAGATNYEGRTVRVGLELRARVVEVGAR